jgi:hypothetical protein
MKIKLAPNFQLIDLTNDNSKKEDIYRISEYSQIIEFPTNQNKLYETLVG